MVENINAKDAEILLINSSNESYYACRGAKLIDKSSDLIDAPREKYDIVDCFLNDDYEQNFIKIYDLLSSQGRALIKVPNPYQQNNTISDIINSLIFAGLAINSICEDNNYFQFICMKGY